MASSSRATIGGMAATPTSSRAKSRIVAKSSSDKGWLHLLGLEKGRVAGRYRPGLAWDLGEALRLAA